MTENPAESKQGSRDKRRLMVGGVVVFVVAFVATGGFGLLGREDESGRRLPARSSMGRQVSGGGTPGAAPGSGLAVGSPAPDLSLPDLAGTLTSLKDLRGRPVLLNVWATWCPPCIQEMPSLERLHGAAGNDFRLISVSVDEEAEAARNLAELMGLSFPVLLDPGGAKLARWGTVKYPETWILNGDGLIVERIIGGLDWADPKIRARLVTLKETGKW